jgi:hypothetical protein
MITHRQHHAFARHATTPHWHSRLVIAGLMTLALGIYVAGIFWFGQGLAEDVRAGVREVRAGALIPDMER